MSKKSKTQAQTELPQVPYSHALEVGALSRAIETSFDLQPDREMLDRIAAFLKVEQISDLRFKGELAPRRKDEWRLKARLTADLEQACVISLSPVAEKVDEEIVRELLPGPNPELEDELELGADDGEGPDYFQDRIDLAAIALEQLALALDPYPRAEDAKLEDSQFTEPGIEPLKDADLKPFAGLADLKEKLSGKGP